MLCDSAGLARANDLGRQTSAVRRANDGRDTYTCRAHTCIIHRVYLFCDQILFHNTYRLSKKMKNY